VEKLQHKISKAILVSDEGIIGGGNYQVLRGLEAELAVEQRLVSRHVSSSAYDMLVSSSIHY
jgi:hypothetical protein